MEREEKQLEGSVNYKVKQTRKNPSGSKPNHVKGERVEVARRARSPLMRMSRVVCASGGRGQARSPVLISCSGFGHRSLRMENTQSCQVIAEGVGGEGRGTRRWVRDR